MKETVVVVAGLKSDDRQAYLDLILLGVARQKRRLELDPNVRRCEQIAKDFGAKVKTKP